MGQGYNILLVLQSQKYKLHVGQDGVIFGPVFISRIIINKFISGLKYSVQNCLKDIKLCVFDKY